MRKILLLSVSAALLCSSSAYGQDNGWFKSGRASAEVSAGVSSNGDLQPLWLYANNWGVYTQYRQAEGLVHAKAEVRVANFRHFTMDAGLGLVGKTEKGRSMLHEAYISGKAFIFDYEVGLKAHSPLAEFDEMTVGNYLMSSGARPTPRIGVGIFDYWSVPKIQDFVQIRGGFYIGRLFNDDYDAEYTKYYTKDVLLHEKFVYGRVGHWAVKPYFGLTHSVMMGGTLAAGWYGGPKDVPVDFWASFFGKGSDKFDDAFRGETTNAAGAHQGLWDIGVDMDLKPMTAHVYFKMPFSRWPGTRFIFNDNNKDFYLGGVFELKKPKAVRRFSLEYTTMSNQTGEGMLDPLGYDKNGNQIVIYTGDLLAIEGGLKAWFYEHFTEEEIEEWHSRTGVWPYEGDGDEALKFFEVKWNDGYPFGGRMDYLGNSFVPQGWTVEGLSMSSAIFHTQQTVETYASEGYSWQRLTTFPNIRVNAVTVAVEGEVGHMFSYLFKMSGTKNKGNRMEKYLGGGYSWVPAENYYFSEARNEYYCLFRLGKSLRRGLRANMDMAWDWGDLYKSFGVRLSAKYKIRFIREQGKCNYDDEVVFSFESPRRRHK